MYSRTRYSYIRWILYAIYSIVPFTFFSYLTNLPRIIVYFYINSEQYLQIKEEATATLTAFSLGLFIGYVILGICIDWLDAYVVLYFSITILSMIFLWSAQIVSLKYLIILKFLQGFFLAGIKICIPTLLKLLSQNEIMEIQENYESLQENFRHQTSILNDILAKYTELPFIKQNKQAIEHLHTKVDEINELIVLENDFPNLMKQRFFSALNKIAFLRSFCIAVSPFIGSILSRISVIGWKIHFVIIANYLIILQLCFILIPKSAFYAVNLCKKANIVICFKKFFSKSTILLLSIIGGVADGMFGGFLCVAVNNLIQTYHKNFRFLFSITILIMMCVVTIILILVSRRFKNKYLILRYTHYVGLALSISFVMTILIFKEQISYICLLFFATLIASCLFLVCYAVQTIVMTSSIHHANIATFLGFNESIWGNIIGYAASFFEILNISSKVNDYFSFAIFTTIVFCCLNFLLFIIDNRFRDEI